MKDTMITEFADTGQQYLLIKLGTKSGTKALVIGDQMVNDLLSACTFTRREKKRAPEFKRSLAKIEKALWLCLK